MHVLIHEFVTGGGWYSADSHSPPPDSLAREGRAMLRALALDFCALDAVRVSVLHDVRTAPPQIPDCQVHAIESARQEQAVLAELAAKADWTVLIAPEFSGFLQSRARAVLAAGGRLLSPGPELIELAADKQRAAEHLAAAGVPVAQGRLLREEEELPADFPYPAVIKPLDGAGSLGVRLIERPGDDHVTTTGTHRLEKFYPGQAASVAVLCGPRERRTLVPCSQLLSSDGRFTYLGGSLPLDRALAARATRLARQTVAALTNPFGCFGIDLVLGPDSSGREDVVLEINPRLTTSYVGLRAALSANLAAAMLDIAQGRRPELSESACAIQFDAAGNTRRL